jgi:hypothetical protein
MSIAENPRITTRIPPHQIIEVPLRPLTRAKEVREEVKPVPQAEEKQPEKAVIWQAAGRTVISIGTQSSPFGEDDPGPFWDQGFHNFYNDVKAQVDTSRITRTPSDLYDK